MLVFYLVLLTGVGADLTSGRPSKVVAVKCQVMRIDSGIDELPDSSICPSVPCGRAEVLCAGINLPQLVPAWFRVQERILVNLQINLTLLKPARGGRKLIRCPE